MDRYILEEIDHSWVRGWNIIDTRKNRILLTIESGMSYLLDDQKMAQEIVEQLNRGPQPRT